jgi:non-heme chloroperoxidase
MPYVAVGNDYDTFANDLYLLMEALDLHDATLVGHSMGTGEVTRYLARFGSKRVASGVLISPIPPFLLQTADNPEGVPQSLFDGFIAAAKQRRYVARHVGERSSLSGELERRR